MSVIRESFKLFYKTSDVRFIKLLHGCTASERFSSDHDKLLTPSLKSLTPPFRQTLSRNKPNHSASAAAHDCNVHIWLLVVNMQWTLLTLVHHESCTGALKASTLGLNGLIEAFYLHFLSDLNKHDESVFLQMSRQRRTDGKQARERERVVFQQFDFWLFKPSSYLQVYVTVSDIFSAICDSVFWAAGFFTLWLIRLSVVSTDTDIFGKPPCYEDAVMMEDPPPPYSEVLADPRGGTYFKPAPLRAAHPPPLPPPREYQDPAPVFRSETSKPPVMTVFPERGYSSLIRLPSSQRWDSLGHLLSNMDLNHNNLTPPGPRSTQAAAAMATMPRREPRTHGLQGGVQGLRGSIQGFHGGIQGLQGGIQGLQGGIQGFQGGIQGLQGVHGLRGLEPSCGLPTAFPLLGRSTAV